MTKIILTTGSCPLEASTTVVFYGRSCGPSRRYFRNTRLLSWNIFCDIFQQSRIWNTAEKKHAVQQCAWVDACCYIVGQMHFRTNKPMIHSAAVISDSSVTLVFENIAKELTWRAVWRGLWPLHSFDLTPRNVCLSLSLKDRVY
jgi:hypothetical protein